MRLFGVEIARIKIVAKGIALALVSPHAVATMSLVCGSGLAVHGIYLLAGTGWALLAAAAPFLWLAAVLIRGLTRAG